MVDVRVVVVERDELVHLIADAVHSAIASQSSRDEWVDARSSGLGRRLFLRLAREGAFPVSKRGRTYVARRADVDGYLEHQRVHPASDRREPLGAPPNALQASTETDANDDTGARALAAGRLRVVKKSR